MRMKKVICSVATAATILGSSMSVFAAEPSNDLSNDPNLVITTHEDVVVPGNVSVQKASVSVTYDPDSGIDWDKGYRSVWGSCQAKQGTIKLDSYSRARFEALITGLPYLDSGRVWSTNQGRSFARSGWELFSTLDSGVAHTYYGIGV